MFILRWLIGRVILLIDFMTSPKSPQRAVEEQAGLDVQTQHLSLYHLPACPFCVKVRREVKRNGLAISLSNINQNNELRKELVREGGKATVPCLRIAPEGQAVEWLYESNDIIKYLQNMVR